MTVYEIFEKQYISRTKRSKELYEEAMQHLAGGVAGGGGYRKPHPLYIKDAKGAYLWDVDGNKYIDVLCGAGSPILGHSPTSVMEAVKQQLDHGTSTIVSYELTAELAEKIKQHMPGMELVRFVGTGSEAVHLALRVARVYTGREKYAKCEGTYHGQLDNELISGNVFGGAEDNPESVPMGAGIPKTALDSVVVLPWNDAEASVAIIKKHVKKLAAVLIEPVACGFLGGIPAEKSYIQSLRKVCDEESIIFIWDEVVTGFRFSLNGAYSLYEVIPDLRILGKPIGGGFPVGLYGGRRHIMEKVVTPGEGAKIFQSGTYSGNPITMTAGLATIKELEKPGFYESINGHGERLRSGLRKIASDVGISVQVTGIGLLFGVHFSEHPIKTFRDVAKSDKEAGAAFSMGLVANDIYCPSFHVMFLCGAHTDTDIDKILDVSKDVLREIKRHQS